MGYTKEYINLQRRLCKERIKVLESKKKEINQELKHIKEKLKYYNSFDENQMRIE